MKTEKQQTFVFICYLNRRIKFSTRKTAASSSVFNRKVQLRETISHLAGPFHTARDHVTLREKMSHCAGPYHTTRPRRLHGTLRTCHSVFYL
jgi:hypothetical protein